MDAPLHLELEQNPSGLKVLPANKGLWGKSFRTETVAADSFCLTAEKRTLISIIALILLSFHARSKQNRPEESFQ